MIFYKMWTAVISISFLSVPLAHTAPSLPTSNDFINPCPAAHAANVAPDEQVDDAIVSNYYVPTSTEGTFSVVPDDPDHSMTTTHHVVPLIDDDTPLFFH